MAGMRFMPDGTHRERQDDGRPAQWYVIWLGEPHREGSVVLGRSRRLARHQEHRFFPADPKVLPREIRGFVNGVRWLLALHRGGAR